MRATKQVNLVLSGKDEQILMAAPRDLTSKISPDHKEQTCLAHIRHTD